MSTKEFNYTREWTDAEAFPLLSFTKNWENPDDYPTIETDEQKVRQDLQSLHDEVKDFLNNELIPRVIAEDATVEGWEAQETARTEAETARSEAETARTEAEQGRADAESARTSAEANRVLAENNRVSAEQSRVTAEAARVSAEQARVDSTNGVVAQATAQANAAKTSADGAKASATAAASSATSASNSASNAASSASSAASSSSSASSSASAARAAQAAAERARDEAQAAVGGDFATKTEAEGYANTAESNAKSYTDQQISAIPTPDVSGQINAHNVAIDAHADIRAAVAGKAPMYTYGTTDLTAGSSPLATGQLHFVYE